MRFEITQTEAWAKFQEAAGRKVHEVKLQSGDRAFFTVFPLPLGKKWLLGMGVDFSRWTREDFENLKKWGRANGCTHVRCEGYEGDLGGGAELGDSSRMSTFKRAQSVTKPYLPQWTIKVDLTASEDDILAQMKRKGRYNITLAQKSGVKVSSYSEDEVTSDIMQKFYALLKETGNRDEFGIHGRKYYEMMVNTLGKGARLYLAEYEGVIISGIIVIYGKKEAVYYYGASSNQHRNVMAPYLLQWQAMIDAKRMGKELYDFMGTAKPKAELLERAGEKELMERYSAGVDVSNIQFDTNDSLHGVTQFKQKFGGTLHVFNEPLDLVISPFWYGIIQFVKKLRN